MAEPRERPLLFSGPMVRALLQDRKTQTRRIIAPQPSFTSKDVDDLEGLFPTKSLPNLVNAAWQAGFISVPCPFGKPGDRLWVRETWASLEYGARGPFVYRADSSDGERVRVDAPWRPSIPMPRRACRLLLEVTEVRVQRLQDISEEDAQAEGARRFDDIPLSESSASVPWGAKQARRWSMETPRDTGDCLGTARYAFACYVNKLHRGPRLDSIAEPPLWDQNPWVWALSFRRVEGSR